MCPFFLRMIRKSHSTGETMATKQEIADLISAYNTTAAVQAARLNSIFAAMRDDFTGGKRFIRFNNDIWTCNQFGVQPELRAYECVGGKDNSIVAYDLGD